MNVSATAKTNREHDIFISYSRKDTEFVHRLDAALQARGREAWVDWEAIRPSEEFMQAIYSAIENADTFVFVLSPDSVSSAVCAREIAHAAKHNKRMIPVVVREVDASLVPEPLAKLNWIFFREQDDFEKATDSLVSAFDTDLEWVRAHTRLLTRAIEWNEKRESNSFALRGEDLRAAELWLAQAGADKERQPTELQIQYIIASRKGATLRQRLITAAVSLALLISIGLTILALGQRKQALRQRTLAEQASQVALARQLAAQSELSRDQSAKSLSRSVLLAVESMRRFPSLEADMALRRSVTLLPRRLAGTWGDAKITNLAMTPDGRYVISANEDQTAGIWEIPSGKLLARAQAQGPVRTAMVSNDGKYLLLGSEGKGGNSMAQLCTMPDGKIIKQIPSGLMELAMAFSPDSKWCAVATSRGILLVNPATGKNNQPWLSENDRALVFSPDSKYLTNGKQVWDALSGGEIAHLEFQHDEGNGVGSVAFSPDGKTIAAGTDDQVAILWDVATGQRLHSFRQRRQRTYAAFEDLLRHEHQMTVSFSEDGKYLATAGGDIQARVWEIEKGQEVAQLSHGNIVSWASFTGNGRRVLTTGEDATVRLWEIPTGHELTRITEDQDENSSLAAVSRDGRYIAVASGKRFALWEGASGGISRRLAHSSSVSDLAFSLDGKLLATSDYTTARVWDVANGELAGAPMTQQEPNIGASMPDHVKSVSLTADAKLLCTANGDQTARLWDVATGREVIRLSPHEHSTVDRALVTPNGTCVATTALQDGPPEMVDLWSAPDWHHAFQIEGEDVVFSPDGNLLAIPNKNKLLVLEVTGQKQLATFDSAGSVAAFVFSPDSRSIAFANEKGLVSVGEIKTGQTVATLKHDGPVDSIIFSGDQEFVATKSGPTATVWDWKKEASVGRFMHETDVTAIALSATGTNLATAVGTEVRVWDIASNKELARIGHDQLVTRVAFSPDGKTIATGADDAIAQLSLWRPQDLIDEACARLTRNLTPEEWRHYLGSEPYRQTCPAIVASPP